MKALILAGGMSRRLGELTHDLAKSCLPLKDGLTVLDYSISSISKSGFKELLILVGHANKKLEEMVLEKWRDKFDSINFVFNPEYKTKNNIYSAFLIKEFLSSNTFIFNSDIVYHPNILAFAVDQYKSSKSSESGKNSFLVLDDNKKLVDEDMKVITDGEKIIRINKELDNGKALGEYIGIMHLEGPCLDAFKLSLEKMVNDGETDLYYEDALDRILISLEPGELSIVSTKGLGWTEIDTPEDYERAKNLDFLKEGSLVV